ncbi:MAG: AbrB/MazE/SpoVT family DNA-binding domain-containing protein [Bifidobacteriaceae bacterium]|jgi:AbrB family looped-hinge helix DNA binding protein|nr:AbrB/MazE/SpoVT family DNA-binding domain-containing protein [Bifidobacteriaceae bacterium]
MIAVTLSSKGQNVIPASIRRQANLKAGDRLQIELDRETEQIRLSKPQDWDSLSELFTSWIKPGTRPLKNVRGLMKTHDPRLG